ncbi:hypothetical protein HETIRDRAFT_103216 [Heterobasidion irregulare TC 32-1]|uniref:Uncharacterized protein n=1 Tax=Heterobasidion irregulare (strain TC 32-1) TaxID=747525 RepID=W4KHY4_HETIT|nr:uncharacterized protein HETIRDRAFT_103216 [Heterobasidion irregulare TC 32-1]ETW84691.1 hypothetical protein HETIRDRAFT_103216 [Heterobasidion irregulare TC 32-1]
MLLLAATPERRLRTSRQSSNWACLAPNEPAHASLGVACRTTRLALASLRWRLLGRAKTSRPIAATFVVGLNRRTGPALGTLRVVVGSGWLVHRMGYPAFSRTTLASWGVRLASHELSAGPSAYGTKQCPAHNPRGSSRALEATRATQGGHVADMETTQRGDAPVMPVHASAVRWQPTRVGGGPFPPRARLLPNAATTVTRRGTVLTLASPVPPRATPLGGYPICHGSGGAQKCAP